MTGEAPVYASDYFTYMPRGHKNCGCKTGPGPLSIRDEGKADYYKIEKIEAGSLLGIWQTWRYAFMYIYIHTYREKGRELHIVGHSHEAAHDFNSEYLFMSVSCEPMTKKSN